MKKIVNTDKAPAAIGPYSQATAHNGTLYVSGQLPIDPATGEFPSTDIQAQTHQVMKNLAAIIEAAGSKMENILKCTILLTDMAHFAPMNETYASYFPAGPPARICYQVCALPKGAIVEIDAIVAV
ncbi:MAG: RidA family protein [Defluviitaleaceae bacterium]|nr:RidA family protein [Defluviitaleaceae bacterium]MCL2239432.1 RidA family protein [Defluviitaleaceae bacterium]